MGYKNIVITGSGKCIPKKVVDETYFSDHIFYTADGEKIDKKGVEAARKLETITGINERRYASDNVNCSDLATIAAKQAIEDAGIDPEKIDQIIIGHNFGNVELGSCQTNMLPSIGSQVKHNLGIENPNCVAYDVIFGCPGWVQGVIQAYAHIKAGLSKNALIIGADTLSRIVDHHDRDSMIYADGAGAVFIEEKEEESQRGMINVGAQTFAKNEAFFLFNGEGFHPEKEDNDLYIKMHGRKIYEFALTNVPAAMKNVLDQGDFEIHQLKKIFIHQANEKMDEAIIKRFFRLYKSPMPDDILPMNIKKLGNSSVATVPTLFDMVKRGEIEGHQVNDGELYLFASVGAGMNINAFSYIY